MTESLVVGLGNPGSQYQGTRHNLGQATVELLARRAGERLKAGRDRAMVADATIGGQRVCLAVPTTYMNDSGHAVGALMRRHGLSEPGQLIVVHDELDLEPGVVRIKVGGGLAGNNGLRSITQHLKTQDYLRVRIGVGKPPSAERGAAHVLARISAAQRPLFDEAIERAADAVEDVLRDGAEAAMRTHHTKP